MSPFSVHRQGKVTKLKEVTFDASEFEVKAGEQPALDSEIVNMVDDAVVSHLNNKLEFVGQNLHSMFDARFSQIETHLGMSPISDDKYASTSNTNRTMGNSAGDGIQTDAIVMSSAKQSSGRVMEQRHVIKLYITRHLMQMCHHKGAKFIATCFYTAELFST